MINDLLVMSRNQQKNALVSETIKANQLWSEVLDNAAFEAEQMGKSLTVNFPLWAVAAVRQSERPGKCAGKHCS